MTTAALLHDLETAKAGSRELSDRVLLAMGWTHSQDGHVWMKPDRIFCTPSFRPSPTESVDWCLANMPERWTHYYVQPFDDGSIDWWLTSEDQDVGGHGASFALALSAALVKIRALVADGRIAESA